MERRWTPNQLVIANVATLLVALVILAVQLPAVLEAAFGPGLGTDEPREVVTQLIKVHDEEMERYQERFNGRSFFFMPPRKLPPRKLLPVVKVAPDEPPETPAASPPSPVYTGPSVIGILGDEVWFRAPRPGEGGLRIRVGEEPQEGITVLATNPPWSVTLAYQRGEYDIDVWKTDFPSIERSAPPRQPIPGLVDATPPTPPATESEADDDGAPAPAETAAGPEDQPASAGNQDPQTTPADDDEPSGSEAGGDADRPEPKPTEPAEKEPADDDEPSGSEPEGDADRPDPKPAEPADNEPADDDETGSSDDPQEQ